MEIEERVENQNSKEIVNLLLPRTGWRAPGWDKKEKKPATFNDKLFILFYFFKITKEKVLCNWHATVLIKNTAQFVLAILWLIIVHLLATENSLKWSRSVLCYERTFFWRKIMHATSGLKGCSLLYVP